MSASASPDPVYVGNTLTYTITATNNGPSDEPNAIVADALDPNVHYVSATSSVTGALIAFDSATGVVTANLGALAANTSATVTVTVAPLSSAADPLTGTGAVSNTASFKGQNYPNSTPSQTISTTVNALADLAITNLQATPMPLAGQPLVFTIKAVNNGPSDATGVVLTDDLPSNTQDWTYVSATTDVGVTPTLSGHTVTADIGTLAAGAKVTLTITVTPTATAVVDSPLADTAKINGLQDDPNPTNNTSTINNLTVNPAVDLAITKFSASPTTVQIGDDLTYTIDVTNNGPSPATGVTVTSPLGAGASYVTGSGTVSPAGTASLQGSNVMANLPTLASGASATITYTVVPSLIETLNASTSVTATETDTVPSNNSAATTTTVVDRVGTIEFSAAGYTVDENAGTATITVNRVDGARGIVTVDYTTAPINATPGLDYTPVSGTLTFPNGVTSEKIVVPVLDNPYDNHNELVSVALSNVKTTETLGQALLGTPRTATLTIQDIDPNYNPLVVTGVQWTGTTQDITQIFVTFSKPLLTTTALNPANWALVNVGADGKYGTLDDSGVTISESLYQSSSQVVALTPSQPLPANQFFHLWINGATPGGVEDVGRNMLAGDGSTPSTLYTAMLARGTNLKYDTPVGDQVSLKLTGGGVIDDLLSGTGQGVKLTVVGEVPHRSVLSGSVRKVRGGTGRAYLGYTIWGLGNFGDVRVRMYSPPFQIGLYPFSPGSPAATKVESLGAVIADQTRSARTKARAAAKPAVRQVAPSVARPLNRPFHAFHR
ncbi:MAG: Calx-beta domain-containing protein [Isosphaeraceae bacterium]